MNDGSTVVQHLIHGSGTTIMMLLSALTIAYVMAFVATLLIAPTRHSFLGKRFHISVPVLILIGPVTLFVVAAGLSAMGPQSIPSRRLTAIVLLSLIIAAGPFGRFYNLARHVIDQDFFLARLAKGLRPARALANQLLRHAPGPILSSLIFDASFATGGAFALEKLFALNGLAAVTTTAVVQRDEAWLMALALGAGGSAAIAVLITDIAHVFLDPRLRTSTRNAHLA